MSQIHQLGDLQYAIMRVLWSRKEATTAEVHAEIHPERGLAHTTIATMLSKMEKKGVVAHRAEGRQYVYYAVVTESMVRRNMVGELIDRVFQGDAAELVNHLLKERDIDAEELTKLKELIEQKAGEEEGESNV
ncbi:MAG: BlaI/MecI/CopY family transcriptional regulator [Planctomycetes bacterium]|nr:BlaI/MecI/CopY family transcriptional regulator [Planctomycetota bacterium]